MEDALLPVLLFLLAGVALACGMIAVGTVLGPQRTSAAKRMPYESGMDPIHDTHRRFDVRFHLVAIAFLVFDVELLFLYPWAVANKHGTQLAPMRLVVFGEVMVFVAVLAAGFVYVWRKGVFRWR